MSSKNAPAAGPERRLRCKASAHASAPALRASSPQNVFWLGLAVRRSADATPSPRRARALRSRAQRTCALAARRARVRAVGGRGARRCARPQVGNGPNALPAVDTVPVLVAPHAPLAARAALGYGLTESVIDDDDVHQRAAAQLAVGYAPLSWLGLGARLDARLDAHADVPGGTDAGVVVQSLVAARSGFALTPALRARRRAALRFPGGSDPCAGSRPRAASCAPCSPPIRCKVCGCRRRSASSSIARATASRTPSASAHRTAWRSAQATRTRAARSRAVAAPACARPDRRVELGRAGRRRGAAPLDSPMRIAAGARLYPASSLAGAAARRGKPEQPARALADGPLYTIEPRFWLGAALGMYFPEHERGAATAARGAGSAGARTAPVVGAVDGRVVDAAGRRAAACSQHRGRGPRARGQRCAGPVHARGPASGRSSSCTRAAPVSRTRPHARTSVAGAANGARGRTRARTARGPDPRHGAHLRRQAAAHGADPRRTRLEPW